MKLTLKTADIEIEIDPSMVDSHQMAHTALVEIRAILSDRMENYSASGGRLLRTDEYPRLIDKLIEITEGQNAENKK